MQLKIATTQNATVYEWAIDQVVLPTENGILRVSKSHLPMVLKLIPGVIQISSSEYAEQTLSISKGIALIDGSQVRITASVVTKYPLGKLVELRGNQHLLELRLQKLKTFGSVEQISQLIYDLEKVKADIQLVESHA